jgi:hypothetical protein
MNNAFLSLLSLLTNLFVGSRTAEYENQLERAPHTYSKEKTSIWAKLLKVLSSPFDEIYVVIDEIKNARSIETAFGYSLDLVGGNVDQKRGKSTDLIYKALIRGKIARNFCDGSIDSIMIAISKTFGLQYNDILLTEVWEETSSRAGNITVEIPYNVLNLLGISGTNFINIVNSITAGGVGVGALVSGTFSFSSDPVTSELNNEFGFDAGTLSAFLTYEKDQILPI